MSHSFERVQITGLGVLWPQDSKHAWQITACSYNSKYVGSDYDSFLLRRVVPGAWNVLCYMRGDMARHPSSTAGFGFESVLCIGSKI